MEPWAVRLRLTVSRFRGLPAAFGPAGRLGFSAWLPFTFSNDLLDLGAPSVGIGARRRVGAGDGHACGDGTQASSIERFCGKGSGERIDIEPKACQICRNRAPIDKVRRWLVNWKHLLPQMIRHWIGPRQISAAQDFARCRYVARKRVSNALGFYRIEKVGRVEVGHQNPVDAIGKIGSFRWVADLDEETHAVLTGFG